MLAPKTYFIYIMASRSRTIYTGVTNDIQRRVAEHKSGLVQGFTNRYRIHRLVYFEKHQDVRIAIAREKEIKAWSRADRVALVEAENPTWEDLAAHWYEFRFDPRRAQRFEEQQGPQGLKPSRNDKP